MAKTVSFGTKFQVFEGDKRIVYRALRFEDIEETSVVMVDCATGKLSTFTVDYVSDAMVKLEPDALINLMITSYSDDGANDVYAWVYRADSVIAGNVEPAIILRQDVYSYLKNPLAMDGKIYVGDCLTQFTMPNGDKLMSVNEFDKVDFNYTISLYIDDTLDSIFNIIPKRVQKKFDKILAKLSSKNSALISGYCSTLRELFEDNKFIDAYRSIFNINQVDFPIILGKQSYNKDGDIILNSKQIKRIEDLLRKHISDVRVIEYDYDIDIKDIVSYSHILISDETQAIFLIAFNIVDEYPVDNDIEKAMRV